ncbi:GTPase family protein [Inhella gelatinilytica]|uniref:GTPase domain-containing protein n=1 Tax=Inhella gelatinilytica TaxID=2795030 RepID=A0A931IXZ0_9BURK|nr:GTPase domain-containing protein [Inhella gelatinilytica]MBH9553962.1 GTPase domain-containing protein [Inhella gelatinilytica]
MNMVWRTYWRQLLPIAVALLSVLFLAVPGVLYLIEQGWFVWWALGFGVLALAVLAVLKRFPVPQMTAADHERERAQGDVGWNPAEAEAWEQVVRLGDSVASTPPMSVNAARELAEETLITVATALHPNKQFAAAHFTVPDVLLALETGARELRTQIVQKVPGAEVIKISHLQGLQAAHEKYGAGLKALVAAYRMFRIYANPAGGAVAEFKSFFQDKALASGTEQIYGRICRELVLELGRLAIDLYGGRLRVDVAELKQSVLDAAPDEPESVPVRILVAGQVNAGKSSLVNALAQDVLAAVSELPATPGETEYRSKASDRPDVILIDTQGLDDSADGLDKWSRLAQTSDLILWIASAANPAREVDRKAMARLHQDFQDGRRPRPKMVLVASHVDHLSPRREWSPPYNVDAPATPKEVNIQAAMSALMGAMNVAEAPCVPVSLRPDAPAYNLETLWAVLEEQLPDAQRVSLRRALDARHTTSLKRVATQVAGATISVGKLFLRPESKKG